MGQDEVKYNEEINPDVLSKFSLSLNKENGLSVVIKSTDIEVKTVYLKKYFTRNKTTL